MTEKRVALIIPTRNAGTELSKLLASINRQTIAPARRMIIDSSSTDETVAIAEEYGFEILVIPAETFDHGATRQMGLEKVPEADVAVYMTQDAVLADDTALERLVQSFDTEQIGAVFGRQLPHPWTAPMGTHARLFNYPECSRICSADEIPRLGMKAAFFSDSFGAYRCQALRAVGGFYSPAILGEDMVAAASLLMHGWQVAYCAEAKVYHAHDYDIVQELRRYFDTGVFHSRENWLLRRLGAAEGEGLRFVKSELSYLWRQHACVLIPIALLRTAAKYAGYKLGLWEKYLPLAVKKYCGMNSRFWENNR